MYKAKLRVGLVAVIGGAFVCGSTIAHAQPHDSEELARNIGQILQDSAEFISAVAREASKPSAPHTYRTSEEADHLSYFSRLHQSLKKNTILIVTGGPDEREAALALLKELRSSKSVEFLNRTLPPESMEADGMNVRQEALKLMTMCESATAAEDVLQQCVRYLQTRGNYNAMLKGRKTVDSLPPVQTIKYVFRPLGNPFVVYAGEVGSSEGKLQASVSIPTPAGGMVFWPEQASGPTMEYLIVEYGGFERIFAFDQPFEFAVEDPEIYQVDIQSDGRTLRILISAQSQDHQ